MEIQNKGHSLLKLINDFHTTDILNQERVDDLYEDFVSCVNDEMENKIPYNEHFVPTTDNVNKSKVNKKPFWNSDLRHLWKNVCDVEHQYRKYHGPKMRLHALFNQERKRFDYTFRRLKRKYLREQQFKILNLSKTDRR